MEVCSRHVHVLDVEVEHGTAVVADRRQSHMWIEEGIQHRMQPLVRRAAAGRTGLRILDCGCGTGSNLAMLRRHGRAVGFDLTYRGVEFARVHGESVGQASIAAIPFPDATFDVATSFDVFQCVPDDVERVALGEMTRVLKPGGRVLQYTYHVSSPLPEHKLGVKGRREGVVLLNVPPASVWSFKKAA